MCAVLEMFHDQEAEFGARECLDRNKSEELLLINNLLIRGCFRAQLPWPCQRFWLSWRQQVTL